MPSLIDIIIRASWQGSRAINEVKKDLRSVEGSTNKGARGFEDYAKTAAKVGIVLGSVTVATKAAYEALERGAGLELTQQRFDRLAISIGTTGEALREGISVSTGGLLSNAQQMALATDLIALGLATDYDQVVRLSRGVAELNQDVGELSLALVNQTTRRFDQLGISAVGFEEKLEALKEQGLDTQAAFTEAFLQQMEEQLERVGGQAGTAAGDLKKLEASIGDVKDAAAGALLDVVRFAGGFDDISEATDALNELADAIEKLGDNFDKIQTIGSGVRFLTDPIGGAEDLFNNVIDLQKELSAEFEEYLINNEEYQKVLDNVADTLRDIQDILGVEIIGNMEAAVAEAESFDRALMNANNTAETLAGTLDKIAEAVPSRGALDRTGDVGGRSAGTPPTETFGTIQERTQLFQDFQDDLTDINTRGQQERAAIEEQYESQRTSIVEGYARQRAEEEEDWLRRRARQEEEYRDNIAEITEQSNESALEAREKSAADVEELERDHLQRIQDIIENADLQLKDAASRLNASAVAGILRSRDKALRDENRNFEQQQAEIKSQLDEQLKNIRDNMQERLEDLKEFHDKRLEDEEEDRAVRLRRMEEAHSRELQELESQYRERMQDLKDSIRAERREVTQAYIDGFNQLTQHWSARKELEADYQAQILEQERLWWQQRVAGSGGGPTTGRGDDGGGPAGGGTTGGGTAGGGEQPSRSELIRIAMREMGDAGWPDSMIFDKLREIRDWLDEQIARWIEDTFGYDVPGYEMGIMRVPKTGPAILHQDEAVLNKAEAARYRAGGLGGMTVNNYIQAAPGMDEEMLGTIVERRTIQAMTKVYRSMA